jgi:putative membrane protein
MDLAFLDGTYCGQPGSSQAFWAAWNFDPPVLALLLCLAVMIRHRRGGLAAVAVLAVAFVSPLCAMTAALFSARVVHHLLLVAVAAPLLAIALPSQKPGRIGGPFVLATATLWIWHLPSAYDLALGNLAVYWVMQASLIGTALVFWRAALHPERSVGSALTGVFAAYLQMTLLGALLTFAPAPLYAIHATAPLLWGLSPLADQQLGGLIMWVPGGLPYLVILTLLARRGWNAGGVAG